MSSKIELLHLYISSGHNYLGHHGQPSARNPMEEVSQLNCVAGRGVEGDRFFDHKADFKGQITFFAYENYESLCEELGVLDKPVSTFRRNVVTRGLELKALIGHEFELQGVRFFGVESCKPCYWMNEAFHPKAEHALQDRGGLRAKILTDGVILSGAP